MESERNMVDYLKNKATKRVDILLIKKEFTFSENAFLDYIFFQTFKNYEEECGHITSVLCLHEPGVLHLFDS